MRRTPLVAAAAAIGALAVLPATATAATWSARQNLSRAHLFIDQPRVLAARNGALLTTWTWGDGTGADGRTGTSFAARGPGHPTFGPASALVRGHSVGAADETIADPTAFGPRGMLVASARRLAGQGVRLAVRSARADGSLSKPRTLRTAVRIRSVRVATNAVGDAAVAWFEDRGTRTDRVYVALRRRGHAFGAPRRLATGRVRSVAVAVGASGDVLVAWDARGAIRTRFRPRGRASFRAAERIRSRPAFFADLHPVVTGNGRAAVAWSAQFASEGGDSGPVFFQVAVRPHGARSFRPARLLERLGPEQVPRTIDAVEGDTGRIVIAWSGSDGVTRRVKVAQFDPGLRFEAPEAVSAAGTTGVLSDLAVGPSGRLLAVWDNGSFEANQVWAALALGAGEPFGAPEAVSPAQEARDGHAAFDPLTREPTVVWSNRPGGSDRPIEQIRTYAQAATRFP